MNPSEMQSFIMSHPQLYTEELLAVAESNEEKLEYVYNYPFASKISYSIDLSEEASADRIPLLLQWDMRWGYKFYGDGLLGCTGCGPTCLSMVAIYHTKNKLYTPLYIARYAQQMRYYTIGLGTAWDLFYNGCKAFGLISYEIPVKYEHICEALNHNHPVILSMGEGIFSNSGHFVVLTGHKNGNFSIHDPNSIKRSECLWNFDQIKDQIMNAWAYGCLNSTYSEPVELI